MPTPRIGISACLLGQNVRYDGGNKLDTWLRDELGKRVEWVPVCPETECGLGIPREPMELVGSPHAPRLVTVDTGVDLTDRMREWIQGRLDRISSLGLHGFVFKAKSPSCALAPQAGLFAAAVVARFPSLPACDELALRDQRKRDWFTRQAAAHMHTFMAG